MLASGLAAFARELQQPSQPSPPVWQQYLPQPVAAPSWWQPPPAPEPPPPPARGQQQQPPALRQQQLTVLHPPPQQEPAAPERQQLPLSPTCSLFIDGLDLLDPQVGHGDVIGFPAV